MNLSHLPIGKKAPDVVNIVVEIPAGSKNKYEYDEEMHTIKLDRVGYTAMVYPYDYGFIPETRSEDGDHLDAFVLLDHSVFHGCVVAGRPIGMMKMIDSGEMDEKIICVPANDVRYDHIESLEQLSPHVTKEIQHFFEHYKDLQGKKVEISGWFNAHEAKQTILEAQATEAKRNA
ncbi:MAG TPA: inorganic diphosphatase [Patescibacteria group bacterium]